MSWMFLLIFTQIFFGAIIGLYFWSLLRNQHVQKISIDKESKKEMDELNRMRRQSLAEPLSERIRPKTLDDVIGQKDGIVALRAALCGANPQHVIIYGPPGIGKTAAARLVLEEAKKNTNSPFKPSAPFIELDGATARFDERGIADPLIGSVHDPIYQGAGAMGQAGIPQPKEGAVTHAHGGVLFIDEIGELHPIQLNKLLKVLEDRKVFLESAYYNSENHQIPAYIHDIFQKGLPADFRLIGATTRRPEEIPPAIRSRCLEIFFSELSRTDIRQIAQRAAAKLNLGVSEACLEKIADYAKSGREAVNIMQIAAGVAAAKDEHPGTIGLDEIEWVVRSSRMTPKPNRKVPVQPEIGLVNGLAVYGPGLGTLLEVEASAVKSRHDGSLTITGIAEEESMGSSGRSITRKSMARASVENVLTVLNRMGFAAYRYHIHVNFPGGSLVDGPSAGISMAVAIGSAILRRKVHPDIAMTGEIGLHGQVKPIGGVMAKIEAAVEAGAKRVIIPVENMQETLKHYDKAEIIPVESLHQVLELALYPEETKNKNEERASFSDLLLNRTLSAHSAETGVEKQG
ncbi:ATP-dependent protease LonB [Sporolactobacillus laevolacticus]|uniref:endopeptidase La n=1 Tax=Sporolactobacillus laevolacticus DSM 442 TaxID=1395513 RepID=V6J2R4_9BACL|nr:ATP-dependent protease LonB [Sporolactobacillus laevolacticus]EST13461.1 Lon protease [Sporolactobacillus laevolacticus DSM 442]MDN3955529.1 ATP-dependent protease LonB [Sporolactobacillus laevolacticus]